MKIDYDKLLEIAVDPDSRSKNAFDTSVVLSSYIKTISNLIFSSEKFSESEMAMVVSSLNRWAVGKDIIMKKRYSVGTIVQVELGNNFSPELSYRHPAVILSDLGCYVFVVPVTSNPSFIKNAYHPIDNPTGKWCYRKVGVAEGFAHDCVLMLDSAKSISKTRIIKEVGKISGDISDANNLFREVRETIIKNYFFKEWLEYQNIKESYEKVKEENKSLKESYIKICEENKLLKSLYNK